MLLASRKADSRWNHRLDLPLPTREDIARHFVCLSGLDMLDDRLRFRQPSGRACFADVIVLLAAQEGAEVHRELCRAVVMTGERLGADFVDGTIDFDSPEDLGGIDEGVKHGGASTRVLFNAMDLNALILAKVWPPLGR